MASFATFSTTRVNSRLEHCVGFRERTSASERMFIGKLLMHAVHRPDSSYVVIALYVIENLIPEATFGIFVL